MAKETRVGIEFRDTMAHYLASLVDKRDFAGAVKYYEDNCDAFQAAGGAWAGSPAMGNESVGAPPPLTDAVPRSLTFKSSAA